MENTSHAIPKELIAFAFVEDEYSKTGDIARGLMPLFAPILSKRPHKQFDSRWFAQEVEAQYDIPMSPLVAEGLAPQLANIGLLYQSDTDPHIYKISPHQAINTNLDDDEFDSLLSDFIAFSITHLNNAGYSIANEYLENGLLQRFKTLNFLALLHRPDRNFYKGNTLTLKKPEQEEEEEINQEQQIDVLCADFALHMQEVNPKKFELLTKIASGALIAEVVLTLQTPAPHQNLSEVTLLIDGPLILDYLDLSSIQLKEFATDLFGLINKLKINKAILKHTIDEIKGTINGPLEAIQRGEIPYGPLGERIKSTSNHAAYARSVYDDLEQTLLKLDIEIIDADDYCTDEHFEACSEEIEENLRNNLGRIHENLERRIRDAKSIASVLRMRGKKSLHVPSITNARFLLITRNEALAKSSRSHLLFKKCIDERDFPPVLTDRQLAGLLWFSAGGNLAALSSKKLIANCTYVMHPRMDVISKMRQCLSEIDTGKAEIFTALMRDQRAQRCLVQSTFGFSSAISMDNAEQILESVRLSTVAEIQKAASEREERIREEQSEKIQQITSQHSLDLLEKETKILQLTENIKAIEQEGIESTKNYKESLSELSNKIKNIEFQNNQDIENRISRAAKVADSSYIRCSSRDPI